MSITFDVRRLIFNVERRTYSGRRTYRRRWLRQLVCQKYILSQLLWKEQASSASIFIARAI